MADVRALLKAKRQEARLTHPYAAYNPSGQLKCTVCTSIVKHASAWEGHLGSKLHRTNVARLREEEEKQRIEQQLESEEDLLASGAAAGKRKATDAEAIIHDGQAQVEKRRRVDGTSPGFPQDFFTDPSRGPVLLSPDSEDEENEVMGIGVNPASTSQNTSTTAVKTSEVDDEYERFQRELLATAAAIDPTEAYDRATVAAEPVIASTEIPGFPPTTATGDDAVLQEDRLTNEEKRLKHELDERELIMDRLLAEERAQEDADTRVQLLKNKLDGLKRKREAVKANKKAS